MNNNVRYSFCVILFGVLMCLSQMAQAQSPKSEFRSVWFQTVWAGDWPKQHTEKAQKSEFASHLDRFERLGINAACFQVRTMCDAFYESPYEPWGQWLTGTRGGDPGYDPLQYLIEEAHKRGIEIHVWINPYRFASTSTYTTLPNDYSVTHPNWVKYCEAAGIYVINPSDPEVRAQIVKVIVDIVKRYDIDGVIFDDYFYQSGYKDEYDEVFYLANNPDNLSRGDWRRHQVNLMVKEVNEAIKAIKPWCRFGIGPAGVAASSPSVAAKYGIEPCPDGSDWQYDGIYSEPVQWFVERSIDYMAPQVYWPIGSSGNDYSMITPWWYEVANKFGRHCYISQSLSGLKTTVLRKPITNVAQNNFDAYEINKQLLLNQASTLEEAPGMVFFNASGFTKQNFIRVVTQEVWTNKAKVPAMTWYEAPIQKPVTQVKRSGQNVTWQHTADTVRYGVYAIPTDKRNDADVISSSKYYQGMSYTKSYTLDDSITTDKFTIAVTPIDRFGNEWAPAFLNEAVQNAVKPVLTFPSNNGSMMLPNTLEWQAVNNAVGYMVQVSDDATFKKILVQHQVVNPKMATKPFVDLSELKKYYWRVAALVPNAEAVWSDTWSFNGKPFSITAPANGAENVSNTPTFTWDYAGSDKTYTLEIATAASFRESEILYSATTNETQYTVPNNKIGYGTTYYARVHADNMNVISGVIKFTTKKTTFTAPQITSPADGAMYANPTIRIECTDVPNNGYRFELSNSNKFPTRTGNGVITKRLNTAIGENFAEFEDDKLVDGVYYARVAVRTSSTAISAYSKVISFTYTKTTGITNVTEVEPNMPNKIVTPNGVFILRDGKLFDLRGTQVK